MRLKRLLVTLAVISSFIFLQTSNSVFADVVPDEQFVTPLPPTADRYTAMLMNDDQAFRNPVVYLEARDSANHFSNEVMTSMKICTKAGEIGCETSKYMQYETVLNYCDQLSTHDCVNEVRATNSDGSILKVNYLDKFPIKTPTPYVENLEMNLPGGGSSFLVDIPGLPHAGGTQYLVTAMMSGFKDFNETTFKLDNFQTAIYAVSKVSGNCNIATPETDWKNHSHLVLGKRSRMGVCYDPKNPSDLMMPCVQVDIGSCLLSWPIPTNAKFGITLKLHTKINGWLHGRISDVQAEISTFPDGDQSISVSGSATSVPGLFAAYKKSELPVAIKKVYEGDIHADSNGSGWGTNETLINGNPYSILKSIYNYTIDAFQEMLAWVDSSGNKATFAPTIWSFHTISSGNSYEKCSQNKSILSGVVTTNSTMYVGEPPTFNNSTKSLEYKVAAPHFNPKGEVFKGIYNLAMRSEFARCIYGFTSAPVSAKITIVSTEGESQVATTSLTESGGWIYLKAAGFTFSSPTIAVQLTQDVPVVKPAPVVSATPVPTPSPVAVAPTSTPTPQVTNVAKPKTTTITCIKGKTTKKVTAVNPKCPSGYKKK